MDINADSCVYNCIDGTICFELIKGLPAAFVTLIIGILAVYIAWRQYRVAKAKLNLDLFEKRMKIYNETNLFLKGYLNTSGRNAEQAQHFSEFLTEAGFLFGKDIEDYMEELVRKFINQLRHREKVGNTSSEENKDAWESEKWLARQQSQVVKAKFGKYLDFSLWK